MEVNANYVHSVQGAVKESLPDGSLRIIRYKQPEVKPELVTIKKQYYTESIYELRINLPEPVKIDLLIIIVRSSANCYKVSLSDKNKSEAETFKTYEELNNYLAKIDNHKMSV